ncbi:unnamed protein product (macronuclear) [Paramecium tetraurelia]|uniref:Transmembrane protein n=1 Tax=Paramecium tetraurelia TaxID=5888 RepID=A0DL18_PARTE|nr:uncharacterized protein GSPATT00018052001 [Paramecium tetraurelia]CAK83735.1 unnamed protein product [Paramecium tetraurelia]|eukprot:XP_001451132.1 hypothetical protein (macronuclear) [Paramecium tetraurelia strain d4-2]
MKSIKLIDNLQAFNIDYKITARHALFLTYGMYLTYQYYTQMRTCDDQIRDVQSYIVSKELLKQKSQIHQQYQQLYSKSNEGILDCTLDKGDWIFSNQNPKINEYFNQKLSLNYKYQTIMPLYLCAGTGFPSLTILCGYFQNRDDRFVYGLIAAAIFSGIKIIVKV